MKAGNIGEWGEVVARLYPVVHAGVPDVESKEFVPFINFVDNPGPNEKVALAMGMRAYPISQPDAAKLLDRGLDLNENARARSGKNGSFDNPHVRRLCDLLDIRCEKAPSNQKADVVVTTPAERRQAYFAEDAGSSEPSFVNAGGTRMIYSLDLARGGNRADILRKYGEGVKTPGTKTVVQELYAQGHRLRFQKMADAGFSRSTTGIGHDELGCLVMDYLTEDGVRSLSRILTKHRQHADGPNFVDMQEALLDYIRKCIMIQSPTGQRRPGAYARSGMILIRGRGVFLCRADGTTWWNEQILVGASFDTPDRRNDYGYLYEKDGELLFDFIFGIRGSFKHLLNAAQPELIQ